MSVMAETHQSAMGPYFAMAAASVELQWVNSVTAAFREALVVKVQGGGGDGGGGDGGGGGGEGGGGGDGGEGGGSGGNDPPHLQIASLVPP